MLCVSSEFFPGERGTRGDLQLHVRRGLRAARRRTTASAIASSRSAQITKGYYWDCDAMRNEIVASYFPTARHVIDEALRRAGWKPDDVSLVLPHNVSARSWDILLGLIGIPRERLWGRNIARVGHTLAGDNFINLRDALDDGSVRPRRSAAALLLWLRRALDGADAGGMTMSHTAIDSAHRRHRPARPRRAGSPARGRCPLARARARARRRAAGPRSTRRFPAIEPRHSRRRRSLRRWSRARRLVRDNRCAAT